MIEFVQLSGALTAEDAAKAITSRIIGMRNLMLPPKLVGWRSASPGFEPVSYCLVMQDTMDSACSNARPPTRQCHPPSRPVPPPQPPLLPVPSQPQRPRGRAYGAKGECQEK